MTDIINFTKTTLQSLLPPEKGRTCYKDSKESGLIFFITSSSTKSFYLYKKIDGKPERIFLGHFPDLSVEQARKAAAEAKGQIAKGKNPQEDKRSIRDEMTFKALFDEYMERHSKKTKKTWKHDEQEITKHVSHWFTKKISTIRKADIQRLHEKVSRNNGLYAANRLLERIRGIFNKAIDWGWKGTNPALGITKNKEKSRDRFLQPHEMSATSHFLPCPEKETHPLGLIQVAGQEHEEQCQGKRLFSCQAHFHTVC